MHGWCCIELPFPFWTSVVVGNSYFATRLSDVCFLQADVLLLQRLNWKSTARGGLRLLVTFHMLVVHVPLADHCLEAMDGLYIQLSAS